LAKGLRAVAVPGGAIVSTSKGCLRLDEPSAAFFISEVLPVLYDPESEAPLDSSVEGQLLEAGIVESSISKGEFSRTVQRGSRVALTGETRLVERTTHLLTSAGFEITSPNQDSDFVFSDLSDLPDHDSIRMANEWMRRGRRSISIWRRGEEILLGPITAPRKSACWHCAQQRLADSLDYEVAGVEDHPALAKAIVENIILAVRYPEVAGYGCLVSISQSIVLHTISPMPWCPTCGGVSQSPWPPINHSLLVPEQFRPVADPRAGPLKHLFIFGGSPDDSPDMPICASCVMALPLPDIGKKRILHGEGKGETREHAIISAIGEGIEHYSASLWNRSELTRGSAETLGNRVFDPQWLVHYDAEQYALRNFPYRPLAPDTVLLWARGCWLDTGAPVLVPAQATYLGFNDDELTFGQTTSSGLAAGNSFEDAALRALYELIERDSFMLHWLAGLAGERIDPDGCDGATKQALEEASRLGAETEVYLLDVGVGCPTVICLGFGDGDSWPGATIGLGTHADVEVALRKAVFEHGHYGPYMRRLMREGKHQNIVAPEDVLNSVDHGLYYCHTQNAGQLSSLRQPNTSINLPALRKRYRDEANLTVCTARLLESGIRAAAVDVTTSDILAAGLRVVRAVGTYAQPIHFGYGCERRNNPRLKTLAKTNIQTSPHPIA
jgi:ribosomal protein S12 methylthiotransferase accessory factor